MRSRGFVAGWVWLLCGGPLDAAYSNLIATADGSVVFFEVQTSLRGTRWYQARLEAGRPTVKGLDRSLADVSEDGATLASSAFGERYCGFAGSTCWTAAPCAASFLAEGPAGRASGAGRRTFLRLSRDGRSAWIEQTTECRGLGTALPPELQGLYEVPGLRRLAPSGGLTLANRRAGRRLITTHGQALARAANTQLHLVDQDGARPIRHQYEASEAVIDAEGRSVVYTETSPGRIRWIDLLRQTEDDVATGSAPALSDDGRILAFLSPEGSLFVYRRESRQLAQVGGEVLEFALTGNGRFVFSVTGENRLVRIELETGNSEEWLEPFPEIRDLSTSLDRDPSACPLVCYSAPEPMAQLGRGSLLVFAGRHWPAGWRVQLAETDRPLQLLSGEAAWFQVPSQATTGRQSLVLHHPEHALRFTATAQVNERFVSCFGALHQEFDRTVSAEDPARAGEVVHLFLTGLTGIEPVADEVPNPIDRLIPIAAPPAVGGEGVVEPLFFGLAPGLIGLQQLDLRILGPAAGERRLFRDVPSAPACEIPPVAP